MYGLEVTHGIISDPAQACARSFQNYGEKALVDPDPNPIQVFLFYDHPTVASRIHLCVNYAPWSKENRRNLSSDAPLEASSFLEVF